MFTYDPHVWKFFVNFFKILGESNAVFELEMLLLLLKYGFQKIFLQKDERLTLCKLDIIYLKRTMQHMSIECPHLRKSRKEIVMKKKIADQNFGMQIWLRTLY